MHTSRYHRQSLLHEIGVAGQERIRSAHVAVIGCGALGSGIIDALARAGVGTLAIADRDIVEWTNLQRQTLYDERHAREGTPKAIAAAERVAAINGDAVVRPFVEDVSAANVERIVAGADLILDGLDNFETRYLLNDVAVRSAVPLIYGGAVGTSGMSMTIMPAARARRGGGGRLRWTDAQATPCLRCVFPEPPPPGASPTCDTVGVLGPLVTIVAAYQATQAIKLLVGDLDAIDRRLVSIALWENSWRFLDISAAGPSPACPCCGAGRFAYLDATATGTTTSLCGRNAVQVSPGRGEAGADDAALAPPRIDLSALGARLAAHGAFTATRHLLRCNLANERADEGPIELTVFPDGRAIVKGTSDVERARTIYAKYVGT